MTLLSFSRNEAPPMRRDIIKGGIANLSVLATYFVDKMDFENTTKIAATVLGLLVSVAMFVSIIYSILIKREQHSQLKAKRIGPNDASLEGE